MATNQISRILMKRSDIASKAPKAEDLQPGELSLNTHDGKLYYKDSSGVVQSFIKDALPINNPVVQGDLTVTGAIKGSVEQALKDGTGNVIADTYASKADLSGKLDKTGTAAKATADGSGNTITSTYATKTELSGKLDATSKAADSAKADLATKATQDGSGNNIVDTYATKVAVGDTDTDFLEMYNSINDDDFGGIDVGTGSGDNNNTGDAIPKVGNRGQLAGYEEFVVDIDWERAINNDVSYVPPTIVVNENSPDVAYGADSVIVENGTCGGFIDLIVQAYFGTGTELTLPSSKATSWTKCVLLQGGNTVTMGTHWVWADNTPPDLGDGGLLILHWNFDFGIASFVSFGDGLDEILEKILSEQLG